MKFVLSIIFVLFIYHCALSQNQIITGTVQNYETNEPLPYVNIGIANKTVGTVSNENGLFKLTLNDKVSKNDTIIFSYIGFQIKNYSVSELSTKNTTVLLHPKDMDLDEVLITTKKVEFKPKKIGRVSKGLGLTHFNFYSYYEKDVDDRLSKEVGMKFKIKKRCHVEDLNFNITSNDFKSLTFRVNFYKIENGVPTDLLVEKNILFEIKDHFLGWYKVDLTPYEIYFTEDLEYLAVTIQWLESVKADENSKYFAISTASSPSKNAFYREKAMDSWIKMAQSLSFYLSANCE